MKIHQVLLEGGCWSCCEVHQWNSTWWQDHQVRKYIDHLVGRGFCTQLNSGLTGTLALWKAGNMGEARLGGRFDHQIRSERQNEFCSSGEGWVQDWFRLWPRGIWQDCPAEVGDPRWSIVKYQLILWIISLFCEISIPSWKEELNRSWKVTHMVLGKTLSGSGL